MHDLKLEKAKYCRSLICLTAQGSRKEDESERGEEKEAAVLNNEDSAYEYR